MSLGSKAWANAELRFCISVLKGEVEVSRWSSKLQTVLYIKELLEFYGYVWQVRRLENWIHRVMRLRKRRQGACQ